MRTPRSSAHYPFQRWPLIPSLAAAAPALAVGHLLGRIGCFLVGDDYGMPSSLPWAVAFPEGAPPTTIPVHPTQIYEAIFLAWLAWWLMRERRRGVPDTHVLGHYMILAGSFRFLLEFIRVNEQVLLGLDDWRAHSRHAPARNTSYGGKKAGDWRRQIGER